MRERWSEYFEWLLNEEGEEGIGEEGEIQGGGEEEEVEGEEGILAEEVRLALKKGKRGKAAGLYYIKMEMLKRGRE